MKIFIVILILTIPAVGQSNSKFHRVKPSISKNGTYRQGHQRTNPDQTQKNNYGSQGNYNPYTGKAGNKVPKK